jgi:hypothetical protein
MAELGVTINTSTIPASITDLNAVIPAVAGVETAVTKMVQSTTQQFQQGGTAANEYAQKMQDAMQRQSGGAAVGPSFDFNKMQAAMPGIEKLGRELDQLRMKYVPLAAAEAQHAQALAEITRANQLGALSAVEMAAAIDRQTAAFARQQAAAKAAATAQGGHGGAANQDPGQRMMQTNMMYQFQDIAVTAAMGMSPAMIALQQGSQMAMNFAGAGGITAGLKGMASGLMGMLQPMTLLPMLIVGVGAAMFQWLSGSGEKVKTLDESMKDHLKTVDAMAKMYGVAAQSAADFTKVPEITAAEARKNTEDMALKSRNAGYDLFGVPTDKKAFFRWDQFQEGPLGSGGGGAKPTFEVDPKFKDFETQIKALQQGVKMGRPDWDTFVNQVDAIGDQEPRLRTIADIILLLAKNGAEASNALGMTYEKLLAIAKVDQDLQIARANARTDDERVDAVRDIAEWENRAAKGVSEAAREAAVQLAIEKERANIARERRDFLDGQQKAMNDLIAKEQFEIGIMGEGTTAQKVKREAFDKIAEIQEKMRNASADELWQYEEMIKRVKEWAAAYLGLLKIQDDFALGQKEVAFQAEINAMKARTNAERIAAAGDVAGAGKPQDANTEQEKDHARRRTEAQIEKEMADATRDRHEALDDLVNSSRLELELIGKTNSEQQALRKEYELVLALKKDAAERGIDVSQTELDLIHKQVEAWRLLNEEISRKKLNEDLAFDRSLMNMSEEDAAIARRLRGTGLGLDSPEAGEMRSQNREEEIRGFARDTAKDFLGSFADVLTSGGDDMGEALVKAMVGAANRTLDKIIDRLLDDLINTLLFGQGGGVGGGGSGGLIGALLGTGGGGGGGAANQNSPVSGVLSDLVGSIKTGLGGDSGGMVNTGGGGGGSISTGDVAKQVWTHFKNEGLPDFQVAAIMGHVQAESGFRPGIAGDSGNALGLFQWNDRSAAMKAYVGPDWKTDVQGQLDFASHELHGSESTAWGALRGSTNLRQATGAFGGYERAQGFSWNNPESIHNWSGRYGNAQAAFNRYGGSGDTAVEDMTKATVKATEATAKTTDAMVDATRATKAAADSVGDMSSSAAKAAEALTKFPAAPSGGGGGGAGGWLSSLLGGLGGGASHAEMWEISPAATAAIEGGTGGLYHEGNVGVSSRVSRHFSSMAPWRNAPRLHGGNMFAADEYPAVLKQGEPVFPSMAAAQATLGGKMFVNVHNYAGANVKTKQKEHSDGVTMDLIIDRMQASNIDQRGSATNNAMRGKFGLQERMKMR